MKRVTRNGLIAAAAASGALVTALPAHADSAANGTDAGSPGLISGNSIQLPVHVPVNVCGNTVNVLGLLDPAAGNACVNQGTPRGGPRHGTGTAGGGAAAYGRAKGSGGLLAGNEVQLPVHLPVNVSGNAVSVVGVGNGAGGNTSANTSPGRPVPRPAVPPRVHTPAPARTHTVPRPAVLAHTGAEAPLSTLAGGAALVLGGTMLYRRFRAGATR
ncbi:chaplin [Streptomyces glomeratus]|uniref:LAXTG-anchored chaplin ChpB n=1 Tax=Streptomyces glomeratus TaxID=284452 RepID=A0ABP6LJY5_9ACTN|nr:chaplin [Streptomyces glomeratus]MCF1509316.1 chaplin [Streptomyces glomeratus]